MSRKRLETDFARYCYQQAPHMKKYLIGDGWEALPAVATKKNRAVLVPIYSNKVVPEIAEFHRWRIRHGNDHLTMITGKRRRGKSTLALQLAYMIDPDFCMDRVVYKIDDFERLCSELPYADPENDVTPCIILDEAGFDLFGQDWMTKVQKSINKKMQVIAKKNLVIFFVCPHRKDMNSGIREGMTESWIHVTQYEADRGWAEMWLPIENKFRKENYWVCDMAFRFKPIPSRDPRWKEYSRKKDSFIDEVASGSYQGSEKHESDSTSTVRDQRDKLLRMAYQVGKSSEAPLTHDDLAAATGMSRQRIGQILKKDTGHA